MFCAYSHWVCGISLMPKKRPDELESGRTADVLRRHVFDASVLIYRATDRNKTVTKQEIDGILKQVLYLYWKNPLLFRCLKKLKRKILKSIILKDKIGNQNAITEKNFRTLGLDPARLGTSPPLYEDSRFRTLKPNIWECVDRF